MSPSFFSGRRVATLLPVAALVLCGGRLLAQTEYFTDFNSGTDTGWKHFDLSVAGLPGGPYGTYTFPPDGQGGKAYEITSIANPLPGDYGPGRAFSYRDAVYSRGQFSVDVLSWTSLPDVAFGFLFRANSIAAGQTVGYVMNYNAIDEDLQFNTVDGEAAVDTIAQTHMFFDPERFDYRWQLTAWGANLLGLVFQLPDTSNPVCSVFAVNDITASGKTGLFNYDQDGGAAAKTVVATTIFDNYLATVPAEGSLGPVAIELLPTPNGGTHEGIPPFKAAVLDRDRAVRPDSFSLEIDGTAVPSGGANGFAVTSGVQVPDNPETFPGATLTYTPGSVLAASAHQARVVFQDTQGTRYTNAWTFTADYFRNPASTPGNRGFQVRYTQAQKQDGGLGNSLQRAFLQLAPDSPISASINTNLVAQAINYSQKAVVPDGGTDGNFVDDQPFPGQTADSPTDNMAMEVTCWLDLPVGTTRFGVVSDDGFQLTSSALVNPILARVNGGTANVEFSAYAAQPGLYPFTLVWYENTGGAHLEWFVVLENGEKVLVNAPGAPAAYTSATTAAVISLLQSSTLSGTFAAAEGAVVDAGTRTITVPAPAGTTFYRVSNSSGAVAITQIAVSGANLVIRYE